METHHEGIATQQHPPDEATMGTTTAWNLMDGRPRGDSTLSEATSLNSLAGSEGGTTMFVSLRSMGGRAAYSSSYGATGRSRADQDADSSNNNKSAAGFMAESIRSLASFLSTQQRLLPEVFQSLSDQWIPGKWEEDLMALPQQPSEQTTLRRSSPRRTPTSKPPPPLLRSWKRRIFLILTEPQTSVASALFFGFLVITITLMNLVMILQTIEQFQFTPTDCRTCGGPVSYVFDDDNVIQSPPGVRCECPPSPKRWTVLTLNSLIYFFTVEWCLRVLTFEPPHRSTTTLGFVGEWFQHLTSTATVLDALAIFPYYIEKSSTHGNGLMSLRLLRLFRVFQLVRLGSYNETFMSLTAVMFKSIPYLKLLSGVLMFGAAFFGSLMYWLEKGDWQYWDETGDWQFVRLDPFGNEEVSPFTSVPQAFWWFFVTATTVGYGDIVPSTVMGKLVATFAMLMGVLVVAFPVSVFSDLWSQELHSKSWHSLDVIDEEEEDTDAEVEVEPSKTAHDGPMKDPNNNNNIATHDSVRSDDYFSSHDKNSERRVGDHNNNNNKRWTVDDEHVVLRKDDLEELVRHMRVMNDSQRKMRNILSKYRLQPAGDSHGSA